MNKKRISRRAVPFNEVYENLAEKDRAEVDAIAKNLQISQKIQKMRTSRNMSQYELSKRAGVSRSYLRAIESGEKTNVGLVTMYRLVNAVGGRLELGVG